MEHGKHWTLIADAEGATGLTGRQLFMEALFQVRGMRSETIAHSAVSDFTAFASTGNAPDYVADYCVAKIVSHRSKQSLRAIKKIPVGERPGPSGEEHESWGLEEPTDRA